MPNKCVVTGCKTNYLTSETSKQVFKFPDNIELRAKWTEFTNRKDFSATKYSTICVDHFSEKYLVRNPQRIRLNYALHPIPTIHPETIPKSLGVIPKRPRKDPKVCIYQPDQMPLFKSLFEFKSIDDVAEFFHTASEYTGFNIENSRECVTAYRVEILHGIAYIKECIIVRDSFEVKLSYQSMPLSLPNFIANTEGSKLTSLHMLVNLPNYCKNQSPSTETDVIKELLDISYYNPKGRPLYSTKTLRFALMMRYTSNAAYCYLRHFLPLPSYSLLHKLSIQDIDTIKALVTLRNNKQVGNDVILLLDEMYLQQQVQYDGQALTGCDSNFQMYRSILCYMVVS